jgi:hypothetical protein
MAWLDEIAHSGAHDIYEMAILSLDAPQAVEFLVQECQSKDRLIKILSTILKQESGDNWWQMYAEHIANPVPELYAVGDIPI